MMMEMSAPAFEVAQDQQVDWHCVLYHKQRTSARTRFLLVGRDVVVPEAADDDGELCEVLDEGSVRGHPAAGLSRVSRELGLAPGDLRVDGEPLAAIGSPAVPVWLVEIVTTDPPIAAVADSGGRFISIMESRGVPPLQRELLRLAYERILG